MSTTGFKTLSGPFSRYWNDFFSKYFCQNIWKYEIFIHQLWPQPVLKHSVNHFQGIQMKFYYILLFFSKYFFGKNLLKKWNSVHNFCLTKYPKHIPEISKRPVQGHGVERGTLGALGHGDGGITKYQSNILKYLNCLCVQYVLKVAKLYVRKNVRKGILLF